MKVTNEIAQVTTTLMTIYAKYRCENRPRRPRGADLVLLEACMRRLLICRGEIPDDSARLPEDPWELFLSEFGPVCYSSRVVASICVNGTGEGCVPVMPSILVSSASSASASASSDSSSSLGACMEEVHQEAQGGDTCRHVRFAPLATPSRQEMGGGESRPIPRWTP
ncbi:hypothetical protein FE257_012497 [Aspergillus nanangensis]|uniref:Uncharacterized protein n=1 Tax=Aspergillus nanangensis TaxID=2582783 RepID=A0AAD4CUR2_ASPNN|nr:hypothetical protein FE257_012497 [Aspergillus nanangensis]